MPDSLSAVYDDIVRPLSPGTQAPDEAPIAIVCEPLRQPDGSTGMTPIRVRAPAA